MYICVLVLSKQKIINECEKILRQKLEVLNSALESVNEAANNETKSTVGDKHETAKAMMQLEQEKLSNQITLLNTQLNNLLKIEVTKVHTLVSKGSIVKTNNGNFFIGIGLGKIKVDDNFIFTISVTSPLANVLIEKKVNHYFEFNNIKYSIIELY